MAAAFYGSVTYGKYPYIAVGYGPIDTRLSDPEK